MPVSVLATIAVGRWGLGRARSVAARAIGSRDLAGGLVQLLFARDPELRKRAADVIRRMTETRDRRERDTAPGWRQLRAHVDELLGRLVTLEADESRTRWHLGLVVARVAHTRDQRLRAARLMEGLAADASVVVRCSGIEGMALLACSEPGLRTLAEEICARGRLAGTPAERCRARDGMRRLAASDRARGAAHA